MFAPMIKGLAGAAVAALLATAPAAAFPTSFINNGGTTTFEDDSGEFVLRPDGQGGFTQVTGQLQAGDIFAGILDITSIGGDANRLDGIGTEVTGAFALQLDSITNIGTRMIGTTAGGEVYTDGDFTFTAASLTDFNSIFGLTGSNAATDANTVLRLWDDPSNNFTLERGDVSDAAPNDDFEANDFAQAIALATDGDFLANAILDPNTSDMFMAFDVPLFLSTFGGGGLTGDLFPGVSKLGDFIGGLTVTAYDGPGALVNNQLGVSGSLLAPADANGGDIFPVRNDADFAFNLIPAPATMGLLGLGLLAAGVAGRRRRA
ncbi:hypothetical protein CCR85_05140 [Rhodothalassium salexigens]|nr:hypothetical protein [Rhodothalassium salexigens]MBK5920164.1 hypothetical protein [Rhodothalassium salexigens]